MDEEIRLAVSGLSKDDAILFLDDAFITGKRISAYQQKIRDLKFRGKLHYIVAISRPGKIAKWEQLETAFTNADSRNAEPNTFVAIEQIILPNWNEERCPWCAEEHLHRERISGNISRLKALENSKGLSSELFLVPNSDKGIYLKQGSYWGPENLNQAILFLMVASMLQKLRTSGKSYGTSLGDTNFMINNVLNQKSYIEWYNDAVLRGSLLRAARPGELIYLNSKDEEERTESLSDLLLNPSHSDVAAEIVVAAMLRKIPMLDLGNEKIVNRIKKLPLLSMRSG